MKLPLFHKDFTLVIAGQIISLFGNAIIRLALSLQILKLTGSAALFGGIMALSVIPIALLSPFGGVLADRISKKKCMVFLDFLTCVVTTILILFIQGSWALVAISTVLFLFSIIQCFYQPAVQASVPFLVGQKQLLKANSLVTQVNALANLAGPVLGGILFAAYGIIPILVVGAVCFFCSAIMEIFICIPFAKQPGHGHVFAIVIQDLKSAFHFMLKGDKILLKSLASIAILNAFLWAFFVIGLPYIITVFLKLPENYYGFAQGIMGVGSIAGAVLIGIFSKKIKFENLYVLILLCAAGVVPVIFTTVNNNAPLLSYGVLLFSTFAVMSLAIMYSIFTQTMLQQMTPKHMLGKVGAFVTAISSCCLPIGQALYGLLFDLLHDYIYIITGFAVLSTIIISLIIKKIYNWFKNNSIDVITAEE